MNRTTWEYNENRGKYICEETSKCSQLNSETLELKSQMGASSRFLSKFEVLPHAFAYKMTYENDWRILFK